MAIPDCGGWHGITLVVDNQSIEVQEHMKLQSTEEVNAARQQKMDLAAAAIREMRATTRFDVPDNVRTVLANAQGISVEDAETAEAHNRQADRALANIEAQAAARVGTDTEVV